MTTALVIRKWNGGLTMPEGFELAHETGETATVRQNTEANGKVVPGDKVQAPVTAGGYAVLRDDFFGYAVLLVNGPPASLIALRDDPDTFAGWTISALREELDETIPAGLRTRINNFLTNHGQQNIPAGWTVGRFLRELVGDRLDTTLLYSVDPSVSALTNIIYYPDAPLLLEGGDKVTVAYTNPDGRTYGTQITMETKY